MPLTEVLRTVAGIEMKLVEFNTEPECRFNGRCDHLACMQAKRWRESSCVGCSQPMGRVLWMFTDGQRAAHQQCAYGQEPPR